MDILKLGFMKISGARNTQYLLGNPEADKHKAIAHYLGFFGFGFEHFPEEFLSKRYIKIPVSSDSESDFNFIAKLFLLIGSNYIIDPGCLYSFHKACDNITSLKNARIKQESFLHTEHFNFLTVHGFDTDGSMFLYIVFDPIYDLEYLNDEGIPVHDTNTGALNHLIRFYAPTQPGGVSVFHVNSILSRFVEEHVDLSKDRYIPGANHRIKAKNLFGEHLNTYIQNNGIKKLSKTYLDGLVEAISDLYS